ncbi:MAG: DUF262 domain-containing protein [Bacilli bacterium]|nr:DUF262 domain-containing protein [Bacilli bacterium]
MEEVGKWIASETLELSAFCVKHHELKIPSYQRGYEWDAYNVQRLLRSLYDGTEDQTFLGAVQISANLNEGGNFIVDGRQRLTTLALFYAIMAKRFGWDKESPLLTVLDDEDLKTAINHIFNEEGYLQVLSSIGGKHDITRLNRNGKDTAAKFENIYHRNASYIFTAIEADHFAELHEGKDGSKAKEMFQTVFFLVVTIIDRDMSQVIRIFDTLNSTGQGLSDEAMFKLRYHAYLRAREDNSLSAEETMNEINKGYQLVEEYNDDPHTVIPVRMGDVLWGYRTYLLTHEEVRKALIKSDMTYGTLGFFETLFSKEETSKGFEVLKLESFHKYIEWHLEFYRYAYPKEGEGSVTKAEMAIDRILPDLLAWTRYSSAWALPIAFFAANRAKDMKIEHAFTDATTKARPIFEVLYFYSVVYEKSIKYVKTDFLWDAFNKKDVKEIQKHCGKWISDAETDRKEWEYDSFWNNVRDNFYGDYGRAYTFLAVMEACDAMEKGKDFYGFFKAVYPWSKQWKRPQIEHIYCQKLFQEEKAGLSDEEKARFNGLGNFVLLEESINKNSLKDHKPSEKFNAEGYSSSSEMQRGYFFPNSKFASVQCLREKYEEYLKVNGDLDEARNWLNVIMDRYGKMKEKFLELFPLFKEIEEKCE